MREKACPGRALQHLLQQAGQGDGGGEVQELERADRRGSSDGRHVEALGAHVRYGVGSEVHMESWEEFC